MFDHLPWFLIAPVHCVSMPHATDSFHRMETLKAWFIAQVASMGDERASLPLGDDEWSLAQVIEHLIFVERAILVSFARSKATMPPKTAESTAKMEQYRAMLASGQKYDVPTKSVEPSSAPDLVTLLEDWEKLRAKMHAKIENGDLPHADILIFDHPIGGAMNAEESLAFLGDHLVYHQSRVSGLLS